MRIDLDKYNKLLNFVTYMSTLYDDTLEDYSVMDYTLIDGANMWDNGWDQANSELGKDALNLLKELTDAPA